MNITIPARAVNQTMKSHVVVIFIMPLPAGGSHWVFDSKITLFPWDDPLSLF